MHCSRWILVVFLILAGNISCKQAADDVVAVQPEVEIDLEAIKSRGYLNALVDNNSISYFIYKGVPMGYEYELLQLLAKELGVSLKITVTSGLDQAVHQLNSGQGDILAFPLTVTMERKKLVNFTKTQYNTYQVLVQRKPENWRKLSYDQLEDTLVRDLNELVGREIYAIKGTAHAMRLNNIQEETGAELIVKEDSVTTESEAFIRKVAIGEIDFTIADHTIAQVNTAYYDNIDVKTVMSLPRQVAWAVRKNSPQLEAEINKWLTNIKKDATFMVIYNRYFKSPRTSLLRMQSDFSSLGGKQLSKYDELIKEGAKKLGWDWRLLASLVYQESHFTTDNESWAGARGLMQLMPETAKRFGATDLNNPVHSMKAGVGYLKFLDNYWKSRIPDPKERLKFILSSYNAGLSHIIDAYKLTEKHGRDSKKWNDNVEYFLLKKSDPQYYRDPVVTVGYCKCEETVNYVHEILERYQQYKIHIEE